MGSVFGATRPAERLDRDEELLDDPVEWSFLVFDVSTDAGRPRITILAIGHDRLGFELELLEIRSLVHLVTSLPSTSGSPSA
jgi:hypothetical protein